MPVPALLTPLPSIAFPHELDRLGIRASGAGATVAVALRLGPDTLLDTTLTATGSGEAALSDLAPLLTDYLAGGQPLTLTLLINAAPAAYADGTRAPAPLVIPCRARTAATAAQWTARRPLSLASGVLPASAAAPARAALYAPGGCQARLTFDHPAAAPAASLQPEADSPAPIVRYAWRWPALLPPGTADFAATLTLTRPGAPPIIVRYASAPPPYGAAAVTFDNAFSQPETLLFDHLTHRHKPARSAEYFSGRYANFLIESATTCEAVSPPLTDGLLPLAADLLEARALTLEATGEELALTEGELEEATDPAALPRLRCTWRPAARTPLRGALPPRVFDRTFDSTYE